MVVCRNVFAFRTTIPRLLRFVSLLVLPVQYMYMVYVDLNVIKMNCGPECTIRV